MSQKRTYLDSLNAGRQRRQSTSIERLNRTLEELEGRIERMPRDDPWRPGGAGNAGRAERRPSGRADELRDNRETGSRYRGSAGETHRARDGELTSISQIVGELRTLRQELGQRMDQGIGKEVAALRHQIERNAAPGRHQDQSAVLGAELERLSAMIDTLATRGSESSLHMLRAEIDEVKSALGELAREETVRSVGRRWEEFDRRWDALASDLRSAGADGPAGAALEDRLEQIETALRLLPESLSLRTLEDKMRTLSGVVEELARQQERFSPDALESIERRLDELSRAIVSSTSKRHERQFDPEPLERIEARISALAHQIEDVTAGQGFDISGQIEGISRRVDDLAHRVEVPEQTVERLAEQITAISARLETVPEAPGMGQVVRDMEDRFAEISAKLDSRQDDAIAQGEGLLRELEQRIERIARGADRAVGPDAGEGLMEVLDSRFAEIRDRLDRHAEATIGRSVGHIEERLDEISRRLDAGPATSNIDADLIAGLHDQVAGLAERLMEPNRHLPEMEDLGPRLDHIERAIAETRDRLVDAARQAAEDAVRTMGENQDVAYSREIGQELRSLENLTRTSDERNARTFEAIHDTLIKIVDRLGSVEQRQRNGSPTGVERRETIESPSMALDFDAPEDDNDRTAPPPSPRRSASEAASQAARAAMVDDDADGGEPARDQTSRSLLGGITRAIKGRMDRRATGEMERKEPTADVDLDRPLDPKLANQPLEPGSGAPDLNAIMRRVRDQRDGPEPMTSDAAKSDFIAAARRAAQAAAAEAEATKGRPTKKEPARGGLSRFLPKSRKSAVIGLATIIVFIGALQMGRTLLSGGPDTASSGLPAISEEAMPDASDAGDESLADTDVSGAGGATVTADPGQSETAPLVAEMTGATSPASADATGPLDLANYVIPESAEAGTATRSELPLSGEEYADEPMINVPMEAGPAALREAAEAGNPLALFEIGNRYAEGRGVEADLEMAAAWYEMAAEMGLAVAQYRLGSLYEKGTGVQRNVAQAEAWYTRAAEQGNAAAMHNLGVLLAMGAGGATDNESAAYWFLEAAELGITDSQFNMGILAAKGIGMEQDLVEGYKWFALVAEAGDEDAAAKRDEVAEMLSAEQLEKARAATKLWRPRTPDAESNSVDIPDGWKESSRTTSSIDMRQAVVDLQTILSELGYDPGPADGIIGQQTRNAISAFQRDNGMEANGEVTQEVVRALLERG